MDEKQRRNHYRRDNMRPRRDFYRSSRVSRGYREYNYYSRKAYNEDRPIKKYVCKNYKRVPSRPASPVEGTEEYMSRKIMQTSAIIMRQLLTPDETITFNTESNIGNIDKHNVQIICSKTTVCEENTQCSNKVGGKSSNKTRKINTKNLSAKEIHEKIINHISNLSEGRKKNFINENINAGVNDYLNYIHTQKRLEISRVLRDMNSSADFQLGDYTNSVVPDIGIKIEELHPDIIEELKRTLNLDLENLNEAIAASNNLDTPMSAENPTTEGNPSSEDNATTKDNIVTEANQTIKNNPTSQIMTISEELDTTPCHIEVKLEEIDEYNDLQNTENTVAVEILPEDISDMFNEGVEEPLSCVPCNVSEREPVNSSSVPDIENTNCDNDSIHFSFCIKEEECTDKLPSGESVYSNSTIVVRDACSQNAEYDPKNAAGAAVDLDSESRKSNSSSVEFDGEDRQISESDFERLLKFFETTLQLFIEKHKNLEYSDVDDIQKKLNLVSSCSHSLLSYGDCLNNLLARSYNHCLKNGKKDRPLVARSTQTLSSEVLDLKIAKLINKRKAVDREPGKSSSTQSNQTPSSLMLNEEDRRVIKKRKGSDREEPQEVLQPKLEIKTEAIEVIEPEHILSFPQLKERVMAIERIENDLLLATQSGNIILASLQDGSFHYTLDVSDSAITSMVFVQGINNFIYLYVGSLQNVLRVYDFRQRDLLRVILIDDEINCMDLMWDYIFMGGKNGTVMRYSCKKEKVEYNFSASQSNILTLKAAQEGPRRVLLLGVRHSPIVVRDAISGLPLRTFCDLAITPTVYSLVMDKSCVYCGTARDNILVFSFHEGRLLDTIVADKSKGISCLKIHKNLLFAGCYNGLIYVYNLEERGPPTVLKGPGGGIRCMAILSNQIVVGTLGSEFGSVSLPTELIMR